MAEFGDYYHTLLHRHCDHKIRRFLWPILYPIIGKLYLRIQSKFYYHLKIYNFLTQNFSIYKHMYKLLCVWYLHCVGMQVLQIFYKIFIKNYNTIKLSSTTIHFILLIINLYSITIFCYLLLGLSAVLNKISAA